MNLLIDPVTGDPRWDASAQIRDPKADFALESAIRFRDGKLSLGHLKDQIVEAANVVWKNTGNIGTLRTLNEVKEKIGKSGKDWFFEFQRVSQKPELIQLLIEQNGCGLTALSKRAGPVQLQRKKGHSHPKLTAEVEDLISTLTKIRQAILNKEILPELFIITCKIDSVKYNNLLFSLKQQNDE